MKITGNEILITGGATGIGFALADAFLRAGNQVVICGRHMDKLDEASACLPGVKTIQADVSKPEDRTTLIADALTHLPNLNLLINNAAISQQINLNDTPADELEEMLRSEIEIDCIAPILSMVDTALNKSAGAKITPQQVAVETLEGMERDSLSETLCERFEIQVERSKILALVSRIAPDFALSFINRKD